MIRKIHLWVFVVFFAGLAAFSYALHAAETKPEQMSTGTVMIKTIGGEKFVFHVEVAATSAEHEKGLMDRTSMQDNAGMLFIFDDVDKRSFWMKDTLIPLDMLFLAQDGEIRHIHHMAKPQDESLITAEEPFKAVLEINGGLAGKLGIKKGDKVLHESFRNVLAQ